MNISKIYSSKAPYQFQAGKYKKKAHRKALSRMAKRNIERKQQAKVVRAIELDDYREGRKCSH